MTEARKRLLKWVGYPVLALVTFVFGVHFMFPYDRLRDRMVEALSKEYDVTIAEVKPGWFPGEISVRGLTLTTRPVSELEKPTTLSIDRVDVSIGLFALIGKKMSVDIDATLGDGRVKGHLESSDDGVALDLNTRDLPLDTIPGIALLTGGAPINGGLEARFKLDLPKGKWAQANGLIEISCSACTIGDGVTKVRPVAAGQVNAFNAEGFTLPRIKLGKLVGKVQIKQGIACIETFSSKSSHGEISLEGGLKLSDPVGQSQAQLYARFKLTEDFKNESPRNQDFDLLMGTGARNADGWAAYQARTPISGLRWIAAHTPPPVMRECVGVAQPAPPSPAPLAAKAARPSTMQPALPGPTRPPSNGRGMGDPDVPRPLPAPSEPQTGSVQPNGPLPSRPDVAPLPEPAPGAPPPPPQPEPTPTPTAEPLPPPAPPPQPAPGDMTGADAQPVPTQY